MEALLEKVPLAVLGVVIPLSTVACVALGCGGGNNQQQRRKKKQQQLSARQQSKSKGRSQQQHGGISSKRHKSGRVVSSSQASQKGKHPSGAESKKKQLKQSIKEGAKEVKDKAGKVKEATKQVVSGKKDPSSASKSSKPSSVPSSSKKAPSAGSVERVQKPSAKVCPVTSEEPTNRRSDPVYASEVCDLHLEPHQLFFSVAGGLQQITLHNESKVGRYAVKVKCSDNGLYRVNPVHAFVEPGKNTSFNVYRNSSTVTTDTRIEKLVLVVAKVSKEETEPMSAFKDSRVIHPMLVLPLLAASAPSSGLVGVQSEGCGLCV